MGRQSAVGELTWKWRVIASVVFGLVALLRWRVAVRWYLIALFATTSLGQDPRRQKLIAAVLNDFSRLSEEPAEPTGRG
jgi:hypothetical protein